MDDYLSFAKQLAKQAREIALKYYKTNLEFETKSDASPVTIADLEINKLVVASVKEHYPEHGVLGEELSWNEERRLLWVCDPIDGTIAFSMGDPTFMFSIALVEDGVSIVAVTCDLNSGDMFTAIKGRGAYRNGEPIHVSKRPLAEAWLALPTALAMLYQAQDMYEALAKHAYQTNVIHGGVFKGMLVAQGLADSIVWPDKFSHPWDVAAVDLIVKEAGGSLTDLKGIEHRMDQELPGGVVVSNGVIHQELLDIIKAAS